MKNKEIADRFQRIIHDAHFLTAKIMGCIWLIPTLSIMNGFYLLRIKKDIFQM